MSDELDAEQIRAETRGYAEELAEWRTERDDLQAEVAKLRSFAQDIMGDWYEGGLDGADLQEIGEKCIEEKERSTSGRGIKSGQKSRR